MKAYYDARLGMLLAVSEYCLKNDAVINAVPAIKNKCIEFNQRLNDIRSATQNLAQPTHGITEAKSLSRQAAIDSAFKVACALYAYAESKKDTDMKAKVKCTKKKLERMRDTEFLDLLNNVYALAGTHAADLVDLGITPALLTGFSNDISAYTELIAQPKAVRGERKKHNAALTRQFSDMNQFLVNELDMLMMTLHDKEPDFLAGYKSVRNIDQSHSYITRTGGTVTKADNTPAVGAKVELLEAGTDAVRYSTVTDASGTFAIKGLKTGAYDVKVSYNGNPEPTVVKGISIQRRKANKVDVVV